MELFFQNGLFWKLGPSWVIILQNFCQHRMLVNGIFGTNIYFFIKEDLFQQQQKTVHNSSQQYTAVEHNSTQLNKLPLPL